MKLTTVKSHFIRPAVKYRKRKGSKMWKLVFSRFTHRLAPTFFSVFGVISVFVNRHRHRNRFSMKTPTFSRCPNVSNSFILIFTSVYSKKKCFHTKLTTLNPNLYTVFNKKHAFVFQFSIYWARWVKILRFALKKHLVIKNCGSELQARLLDTSPQIE